MIIPPKPRIKPSSCRKVYNKGWDVITVYRPGNAEAAHLIEQRIAINTPQMP